MKTINSLLSLSTFILCFNSNFAQNFYVSSSAPNNGNGSIQAPWNSLNMIQTLLESSTSVDTIFLKCGDIFREQLSIQDRTGIVITSYGTGNKPIISGANLIQDWSSDGSKWFCNISDTVKNFFVNNKEQILAQYPDLNQGFLTVDNATNSSLTDAALSSFSSDVLNASQICIHTAQWCWEKTRIQSNNGTTINYTLPTLRTPTANYGYFLYDEMSYLTSPKEWIFDLNTHTIFFIPENDNPNNSICEATIRDYGIRITSNCSTISISNISFEKQFEAGIEILNSSNSTILINNCSFSGQYKYGINQQGTRVEISNSYFREVDGLGIYLNGNAKKTEVHHNTFRNIGEFRNSGIGMEINLSAIKGAYVDSCHIHHNNIDSAGYCGISMDGKWNIIERNIIKNAMLLNNDGAALKSFGIGSQYNIFRNNFVSKSEGNIAGTPNGSFITPAIYFDFSTNYCTIENNTIYDHSKKGIFLNASTNNNSVIGNVVYGGNYLLDYNGAPNPSVTPYVAMTGMTVKKNSLFSKDQNSFVVRMLDNTGGFNHGEIDSNFYFQPYNTENHVFYPVTSSTENFNEWQNTTGYDENSRQSFVFWNSGVALDTLIMNQTDDEVIVNLGEKKYLRLDSTFVCGNISLDPFTSIILIETEETCNTTDTETFYENYIPQLFPNPTNDFINIPNNNKAIIEIYSSLGTLIYSGYESKIYIGNLQDGVYYIKLTTGKNVFNTSFVKL